jgi:hypothetical protein
MRTFISLSLYALAIGFICLATVTYQTFAAQTLSADGIVAARLILLACAACALFSIVFALHFATYESPRKRKRKRNRR